MNRNRSLHEGEPRRWQCSEGERCSEKMHWPGGRLSMPGGGWRGPDRAQRATVGIRAVPKGREQVCPGREQRISEESDGICAHVR